jgi:hypothetical protein
MSKHEADLIEAATAEADSIVLPRIDEASATARPATVGTTYVEQEYDAQSDEQQHMHVATGEAAARPHRMRADGLRVQVEETSYLLQQSRLRLNRARKLHRHAVTTLTVYTRRDRFALYRYVAAWFFLGLGDAAGILGAAITLGEIPLIALGQALATGFAAVTSGQAGADLKDLRMARQRQRNPKELTEAEGRYRHLFTGMDAGVSIMKVVGWMSLTIVLIISIGIFSLRLSVEGMVAGLAFGALAAGTALGSFVSTYSYTDDVADLLATYERRYRKAVKEHTRLASASTVQELAEATAAAKSLTVEHIHRGNAASRRIDALCQRVLRRNPGVLGHGPAAEEPTIIGRRFRGDAA